MPNSAATLVKGAYPITIPDLPELGVELNPIVVRRKRLSFDDAVAAWAMRLRGEHYNTIAHRLGCNPARLGEVFRGERHRGARKRAVEMLSAM